jgi:hypothetical protein
MKWPWQVFGSDGATDPAAASHPMMDQGWAREYQDWTGNKAREEGTKARLWLMEKSDGVMVYWGWTKSTVRTSQ